MAGEHRSWERRDVKMGRSKFPGRPSKIPNRRRVNLSNCELPEHNDSSKAAENICRGLFVFNETFGDSGMGSSPPFIGFSRAEVDKAMGEARLQQKEAEAEYKKQGIDLSFWSEFQEELHSITHSSPTKSLRTKKTKVCFDGGGKGPETVCHNEITNESAFVKIEDSIKANVKLNVCRNSENSVVKNEDIDGPSNIRKKVRRKLLLHSPKSKSLQSQAALKILQRAKKVNVAEGTKSIKKEFVLPVRSAHSSRVIKPNKKFLEVSDSVKNVKKTHEKEKLEDVPSEQTEQMSPSGTPSASISGKVILRAARLQVSSTHRSLGEGPFSSPSAVSLVPVQPRVSTVLCGICGTVRSDKVVKQARKFGVMSCDSCRKFISKMIRRRSSLSETGLKCLKGSGMCMAPPAVWSSPMVPSIARCQACWLKVCLRNFQIPVKLKLELQKLLPPEMKGDGVVTTSVSANLFPVPDGQISFFKGFADITEKSKPLENSYEKGKKSIESKTSKKDKSKRNKSKSRKKQESSRARQGVPLPGPRVKHVCRSASVALGQPLATFGDKAAVLEGAEVEPVATAATATHEPAQPVPAKQPVTPPPAQSQEPAITESKVSKQPVPAAKPFGLLQPGRKKKSTTTQADNMISTDFWENYDPDEICETGFSLIGSESFSLRALCYLCGSAGLEKLVHCACCCEPYHEFCVTDNQVKAGTWRYDWVCPRCTLCATCRRPSGQQLKCVRCENSYHSECVGARLLHSPDRPWVCSACLRCKSCSATDVSVFVGNLPLCKQCFVLRQKGNFCPLCQRCYEDDDYDCKMMECGVCQSWVHAKCEGISDEKYQVLSFLPESVEFICRMCCAMPPAPWWLAVEAELKAGYLGVLKALSKNRTACRMLKWSPKKICSCRRRESLKLSPEEDSLDSDRRESPPPNSDSGIGSADDELKLLPEGEQCFCFLEVDSYNSRSKPFSPNLLSIKKKVTTNEYSSLAQFHEDMQNMLETTQSGELIEVYHSVIKEVFPWFDPKGVKVLGGARSGSHDGTPVKSSPMKSAEPSLCLVPINDLVGRPPEYFYGDSGVNDVRVCILCKMVGDGPSEDAGRLLYCGQNEWVHCNCALWSGEVFEEIDGSLQNVHSAISRGRGIRCPHCQLKGASVGCCAKSCSESYHFSCARAVGCIFLDDKSVYCPVHSSESSGRLLQNEKDFELRRPVYVELDKKRSKPVEAVAVKLAVGSLQIESIGRFVPELSDLIETIMPADFRATRIFWSSKEPWRLVRYRFTIRCIEPELAEGVDLGVNITVDHCRSDLDARLKQLRHFQLHHTLIPLDLPRPAKRLKRRVFDPLDETDNQDLLPPDLEEAILKELSPDMIEGISVQDIFQDISERDRDDDGAEDDLIAHPRPRKTAMLRSGNWNSKADKQEKGETRWKRKTQEGKENKMVGWCARLLQVDGTVDSSSGSEAGESPGRSADIPTDIPQLDGAEDSDHESCDGLPETDEAPVECGTCRCTYRTQRSYERHLESRCHDLLLSSSEEEEEPSPPPPPPTSKPAKPRTYARKKPIVAPLPHAPTTTASVIIPSSPVPVILQEVSAYQPMVQYIMEPQKSLILPNAYQVVLPSPSQMVLGTSSPMFEVVSDPNTGGMFLAQPSPQPVLYNMETIVSNTVMQTNQFVSSSYSQTSTQVFQASKLEQVVNVPTGYVFGPSDLICVPVTPPTLAPPPVRTHWSPPKPKHVVAKQEIPPRPMPPKVKPRSRALVDYINNFRSDTPDIPGATVEGGLVLTNGLTTGSIRIPVSSTLPTTLNLPVTSSLSPSITLPRPSSFPSTPRRPLGTSIRKATPPSQVRFPMPVNTHVNNVPFTTTTTTTPVRRPSVAPIRHITTAVNFAPTTTKITAQPARVPHMQVAPSISMPSLDDSPPVNCDNSPSLHSSTSLNLPMQMAADSTTPPHSGPSSVNYFPSTSLSSPVPLLTRSVKNSTVQLSDLSISPQLCLPSQNNFSQSPPSPFLSPPSVPPQQPSPMHCQPNFTPPLPPPPPVLTSSTSSSSTFTSPSTPRPPVALHSLPSPLSQSRSNQEPPKQVLSAAVTPKSPSLASSASNEKTQQLKQFTGSSQVQPPPAPSSQTLPPPRMTGLSSIKPFTPLQYSKVTSKTGDVPKSGDQSKSCLKELKITPRIVEPEGPKLIYDVVADDGFKFSSTSLSEVWQKICESVQEMRAAFRMPTLPMASRGHEVLGMNNHGLQHLLEQLPGVGYCKKYQAKYFKQPRSNEEDLSPIKENITGCARSEGFSERKEPDKFGWLASKHRKIPRVNYSTEEHPPNSRRSHNLPMAMRYRQLREYGNKDMFVYRSKIHGMGLFCLREIEAGEMVIEYSGELIRSALTDKREKFYTDKGMGCYMFRIDDHYVVDATMGGSPARFINHSCEPNCYSKVVDILGDKHIIIFALRRISIMEELTYDYKFPFEDVKISCHCLSKKCRKYLN